MKKQILVIGMFVLIAGTFFMAGCSKSDTTPPVITLKGSNPMSISLNSTFVDPGSTANDNKDGDISSKVSVSGTVSNNVKGSYTLTYSVTDAAGNVGTATRTVNVVNDAEFLQGAYVNAIDSCFSPNTVSTFDAQINTSNTVNNSFTINGFGAYGTSVNIAATLDGTHTIISFLGSQPLGTGATLINANGNVTSHSSPTTIYVNYTWTDGTNTQNCHTWYNK
jgi:hypothetical protein